MKDTKLILVATRIAILIHQYSFAKLLHEETNKIGVQFYNVTSCNPDILRENVKKTRIFYGQAYRECLTPLTVSFL